MHRNRKKKKNVCENNIISQLHLKISPNKKKKQDDNINNAFCDLLNILIIQYVPLVFYNVSHVFVCV